MADIHGIVADVGGTHVRIAAFDGSGALGDVTVSACADHASLADAFMDFLKVNGMGAPAQAAVCVAGPVDAGVADMTNHPWTVAATELAAATGIGQVTLLNDFEALAISLPHLGGGDLKALWHGSFADPTAPRLAIGPGTGLGVSAWVPDGKGGGRAVATEGGHLSLAPRTADEDAVLAALRDRHDHVSFERVVSGAGLETLFEIVSGGRRLSAADIADHARDGEPSAVQALHHFFAFLGTVTSDLVLAHGARGGVYFGGGMLPKLADMIQASPLRSRLCDKGRFSDYVAAVPVHLITHPVPALVGLAAISTGYGDDR